MSKPDKYSRAFGVEIECGFPGSYRGAGEFLGWAFDQYGTSTAPRNMRGWMLGSDGSGVELKTPKLRGQKGIEKVRAMMDRLKNGGGYVTSRDGLHIHHDAPEFVRDPKLVVQLVKSWMNNREEIHSLVHPERRGRSACPPWDSRYLAQLEEWARGDGHLYSRRHDLNVYSLLRHGTIEIRLHEGTLDPDVMEAWVKFGQRLIYDVLTRKRPVPKTKKVDLLGRMRLAPEAIAILKAKQEHNYRTPGSAYMY